MGRSWDEPFTLYGLLAESVETGPDREWVEFTLREEARFSDGSPVTVEDVIWSYEMLGTEGHPRYRAFWEQVDAIEQTGPRTVRLTFSTEDRELALLAGMRPILKKAQWDGRDFAESGREDIPLGSAPYVVADYEAAASSCSGATPITGAPICPCGAAPTISTRSASNSTATTPSSKRRSRPATLSCDPRIQRRALGNPV